MSNDFVSVLIADVASNGVRIAEIQYMDHAPILVVDVPNDYEDVKRIQDKILMFDERTFVFTGWNSDTHRAYFKPERVAVIAGKRA